jgi:hypothetical protein
MQLDAKATSAFLKALQTLSDEHGLGIDTAALAATQQAHSQDASFYLQTLFAHRTVSHNEEQGEDPIGAYPRLLLAYAEASGGSFAPSNIETDSDDGWDSLTLGFQHAGKKQRIKVNGVEDSDWFTGDFVKALNRFAKRANLPGRWVDFHNGDDACTSIYVPEAAQARFKALRKKYSTVVEEDAPTPSTEARLPAVKRLPAPEICLGKTQLELRKAAWADIKFRLQYAKCRVSLKACEAYFIRGKEPNIEPYESDPLPLVYRLWLAPDQSIESWVKITERLLAGPTQWTTNVSIEPTGDRGSWSEVGRGHLGGHIIAGSLSASYEVLVQKAGARYFDGSEPFSGSDVIPPLGFMGGCEKKLYHFLSGQTPGSEHLQYDGKKLFAPGGYFGRIYYADTCRWLDGTAPSNPYCLYNYMGAHWVRSMDASNMATIEHDEGARFYLSCFLVLVARYPESGVEPERAAYCSEVRQLLNAGPLLEPLNTMWNQAKNERGRVDLNAYMQEPPLYIAEFQ